MSARRRAALTALGYLDYADHPDTTRDGVVVRDSTRANPGWNLVTYHVLRRVELIDGTGRLVHTWSATTPGDGMERWASSVPLPDGDLLVITRPPGLQRIRRDGRVVWTSDVQVHHHAEVLANGNIVALTSSLREFEGFSEPEVIDNGIAMLSPAGALIERRSLLDVLSRRADVFHLSPPDAPMRRQRRSLDVLHANRVDWIDAAVPGRPLFVAGTALVTLRHQDSVVLVDWKSGEAVWAWGRGTLQRPHDASVLPNGDVLVFDNVGLSDTASRVVEVDPSTDAIVWTWVAPKGRTFLSRTRGTAQRLTNGNTLIGESNAGRAFEVTRAGDVVWEYRTSHRNLDGNRAAFRIRRYPRSYFAWVRDAEVTPATSRR